MLRLYCAMVDSPVVPSVEYLPWAEVSSKSADETILNNKSAKFVHLQDFVPKAPKSAGQTKNQNSERRHYSKTADKVGREGEKAVFENEKEKLIALGREDLATKVIWHRDYLKDRTPGWDITSFNEEGRKIFIEVKSTVGAVYPLFNLQQMSGRWQEERYSTRL